MWGSVAAGAMQLGNVQAFIQYSRQFTRPLTYLGSMANLLRAGAASPERVIELQGTWLFGGTIRDNIAYGRPGATEEEILEAAQATYVDRFVRSLPESYDTVLDDRGLQCVRRERQLLTIARAFLARPSGRGHQLGGHPHRGAGAEGDERAAVRPDELRDRALPPPSSVTPTSSG